MNRVLKVPDGDVPAPLGRFGTSSIVSRLLRETAAQSIASSGTARGSSGQAMTELRGAPRQRTYKAARIAFGGGRAVITCLVRNLSKTGACLSVDSPVGIPESINLVFDSGEPSRMSRVIWRNAKQMGVAFC
jgi:PilZ domain-containing protein